MFQMNFFKIFDSNIRTLQIFILSFEDLEVLQSFLVRVLHFEELSAERSRLFLWSIQLSLTLLILLLPLRQNLRKAQIIGLNKDGSSFYEGHCFSSMFHINFCCCMKWSPKFSVTYHLTCLEQQMLRHSLSGYGLSHCYVSLYQSTIVMSKTMLHIVICICSLLWLFSTVQDVFVTLSKLFCFLSRLAAWAFALSTSVMRSSTSPCSLCFVFSKDEHLAFTDSMASSASCKRWVSFFLSTTN